MIDFPGLKWFIDERSESLECADYSALWIPLEAGKNNSFRCKNKAVKNHRTPRSGWIAWQKKQKKQNIITWTRKILPTPRQAWQIFNVLLGFKCSESHLTCHHTGWLWSYSLAAAISCFTSLTSIGRLTLGFLILSFASPRHLRISLFPVLRSCIILALILGRGELLSTSHK